MAMVARELGVSTSAISKIIGNKPQSVDKFDNVPGDPLIFEPFVGHSHLGCQRLDESIWSLAAQADGYGQPQVATEFGEFADLSAASTARPSAPRTRGAAQVAQFSISNPQKSR
jgi:hypothetical protein